MAVMDVSHARNANRYWAIGLAALITGLLTAPAETLVDHLNLLRGLGGFSMVVSGAPFAILIVTLVRVLVRAEWWRALTLGFVVVMAFAIAIAIASETSMDLTGRSEIVRNAIAGLVGGFLGSALLVGGVLLLHIGGPRGTRWLQMIAAGTLLGVLLAFDVYRQADNFWVLFPIWQVVVTLLFVRALETPPA